METKPARHKPPMNRQGTVDKVKGVKCRQCSEWVEFDTDRQGHLQAYNHDLTLHRCKNP